MTCYETINTIAFHVEQFMKLHDYCLSLNITTFGYGLPTQDANNDPNSAFAIYRAVVGRLHTLYGNHITTTNGMICFTQTPIITTKGWVDM